MFDKIFKEIDKSLIFELSKNLSEIFDFEENYSYQLPEDVKEFYRRYETVKLFTYKGGWQYRFVPISEMRITGLDIYGKYYENDGPSSWFTICDVMDGNYIAVDLASKKDNQWNYIDCFHETYGVPGECKVIAKSFVELLERCLHSGDTHYYLEKDFQGYGDALEITPETAIRRIEPIKPQRGWFGEFIRRRKNPHVQPGWRVKFVQPNNSHLKFFGDRDYGSKEKSFDAAKKYLYENIK
jgi:cell wall assembly regulator SMI1